MKKKFLSLNIHLREILQGASLTFSAKVLGTLAGLGTSLIVARCYGTSMVGTLAIINAVLGLSMVFCLLGTDVAILRLIPEYVKKYSPLSIEILHRKMTGIVVVLSVVVGVLLLLSSSFLCRRILHHEEMNSLVILTAFFIGLKSLSTLNTETIRALQKIKIYAVMQCFPFVLNFILIAILTLFFFHDYNPVSALFLTIFTTSMVLLFYVFSLTRQAVTESTVVFRVSFKDIFSLSTPMFLTSAIFAVIYQSDTLMLGYFRSESEVGIYSIALKLAVLTNFILISVNSITAAKFSQLYHNGEMEQFKIVAQGSTKIAFWGIMPVVLVSFLFGKEILGLFGEEFKIGYYAFLFLLAGQCVNVAAGAVGLLLAMTGYEKIFRNIIMLSGILNLVLNAILIPVYHINGAAIASMVSIITWNVLASRHIKKQFGFSIAYFPWICRGS